MLSFMQFSQKIDGFRHDSQGFYNSYNSLNPIAPYSIACGVLAWPIDFRIAQHVWDDQIHLQNWKQAQNAKLIPIFHLIFCMYYFRYKVHNIEKEPLRNKATEITCTRHRRTLTLEDLYWGLTLSRTSIHRCKQTFNRDLRVISLWYPYACYTSIERGEHFMKLVITDYLSFTDKDSDILDFDWLWSTVIRGGAFHETCHHWLFVIHWQGQWHSWFWLLWSTVTDCCHGNSQWMTNCQWWQVIMTVISIVNFFMTSIFMKRNTFYNLFTIYVNYSRENKTLVKTNVMLQSLYWIQINTFGMARKNFISTTVKI